MDYFFRSLLFPSRLWSFYDFFYFFTIRLFWVSFFFRKGKRSGLAVCPDRFGRSAFPTTLSSTIFPPSGAWSSQSAPVCPDRSHPFQPPYLQLSSLLQSKGRCLATSPDQSGQSALRTSFFHWIKARGAVWPFILIGQANQLFSSSFTLSLYLLSLKG